MNINGMGTSSMYSTMQSMQKPSASEIAEDVFSTLDSSGKGYIEQADLASAMSSFSSSDDMMSSDEMFSLLDADGDGKVTQQELTSSFEDMAAEMRVRSQGGSPPPPPPPEDEGLTAEQLAEMAESTGDTEMAKLFAQLAENFDEADVNGDGKVTHDEAMNYQSEQSGSEQTMAQGAMPPPPPPNGSGDDSGFTQEELTEMAASEDSPMAGLFSQLAENFDAADTNEDGTVSQQEAMAFQQSAESSSTENSDNAQLMRVMAELMKTYANTDTTTSLFSDSV
jgi:Ca2+-binding EF-hand superfamily protein